MNLKKFDLDLDLHLLMTELDPKVMELFTVEKSATAKIATKVSQDIKLNFITLVGISLFLMTMAMTMKGFLFPFKPIYIRIYTCYKQWKYGNVKKS